MAEQIHGDPLVGVMNGTLGAWGFERHSWKISWVGIDGWQVRLESSC